LEGIKVWVLGVVTPITNNKHINIETALEWIERIKPERAYFTHMGSRMDYDTLCRNLPDYIRPVYDGMEIEV
ncbi:MAG: MBL fold metallo-hydrolase, partial [Alphaproteobacteria bacterium]|nr:MBL fold metallo-hydrolase [Alphaproteobacteria bacterium]